MARAYTRGDSRGSRGNQDGAGFCAGPAQWKAAVFCGRARGAAERCAGRADVRDAALAYLVVVLESSEADRLDADVERLGTQLAELGGRPIMYRTGHSLIKAKMKETHAELAGEMSGHMFFADGYYGFDDALYAACRLMEIVARSGKPLSAQLSKVPKTVSTPELRNDCPDETKFTVVKKVFDHFKSKYEVLDVDGARINFASGWGLVRASNTQPVLVMRFEATTPELLNQYRAEVEAAVEAAKL